MLMAYLQEREIIDERVLVIDHVDNPEMLAGKHVIDLPQHIAARAAMITFFVVHSPRGFEILTTKYEEAFETALQRMLEFGKENVKLILHFAEHT